MARAVAGLVRDLNSNDSFMLSIVLIVVGAGGMALVGSSGITHWKIALLWSGAFVTMGFVVGFLFGIPMYAGGEAAETAAGRTGLKINTNLEQVSNWLTKMLVGVGLVELRTMPEQVQRLSYFIGQGLGGKTDSLLTTQQVAGAMILGWSTYGFLAGYLLTRVYLSIAFSRSDLITRGGNEQARSQLKTEPLEDLTNQGYMLPLSAAAKAEAAKLRRIPLEEVPPTADWLGAWSRAQVDHREYLEAVRGYDLARGLFPTDAGLQHGYAIALKMRLQPWRDGRGQSWEWVVEELRTAVALVDEAFAAKTVDMNLVDAIYHSATYNALYMAAPGGWKLSRQWCEQYLAKYGNSGKPGAIYVNLACSYGQEAADLAKQSKGSKEFLAARDAAMVAMRNAIKAAPEWRERLLALLTAGRDGDDDLSAFADQKDVMDILQPPAS